MGEEAPVEMPDLPNSIQRLYHSSESKLFGVTIRAIGFIEIVTTVCLMSFMKIEIKEPLYTLCTVAVGFYFGSKNTTGMMTNK